MRNSSRALFWGRSSTEIVRERAERIADDVAGLSAVALQARGLPVISDELFERYRVRVPVLDEDRISISDHGEEDMDMGPAYGFGGGSSVVRGTFVVFSVPFSGDSGLFLYQPAQSPRWGGVSGFDVSGQSLLFRHSCAGRDAEAHKAALNAALADVKKGLEALRKDTTDADGRIRQAIDSYLEKRSKELSEYSDMIQGIGFPLKEQNR